MRLHFDRIRIVVPYIYIASVMEPMYILANNTLTLVAFISK